MRTAAVILLPVVLVVVGATAVVSGSENTTVAETGRINVTATLTHKTVREAGPDGRQSNASEQAWRITDKFGTTVGRMLMTCRWVVARARLCSGEITMPRGKITFLGSSATQFEGEYAVTGGTRAYSSGGGVMLFTAIGLRKTILLVTITT